MATPTFHDMKKIDGTSLGRTGVQGRRSLGRGIFGSVRRNRAHSESDVDIVCAFKDHLRSGEPADLRERESGLHPIR